MEESCAYDLVAYSQRPRLFGAHVPNKAKCC